MAFLIDEETGNITLVQGDSGTYPLEDVPCDKDYTIYFGMYNEKRKPIGYELSKEITSQARIFAWTYSTTDVYTQSETPIEGSAIFDGNGELLTGTITDVETTTITVTVITNVSTFYEMEDNALVEMETQPEYDSEREVFTYNGYDLMETGEQYEYDGDTYYIYTDSVENTYYVLRTAEEDETTYTRNSSKDKDLHYDIIPTTNVTFNIPASLTDYLTVKNNEEYATYYFGVKLCSEDGYEDTLLIGSSQIGDLNTITVYPKKIEGTING